MKRIIIATAIFLFLTAAASYAADGIDVSIAPKIVEFHLINPNGLITGYTSGGVLSQITGMEPYTVHCAGGPEGSDNPYDEYHLIEQAGYPANISPGIYKLVVYGINTPIQADIAVEFDWLGATGPNPKYHAIRLIYPNAVWTYEFNIPPAPMPPGSQIILTKVANATDLIKDITTAGQLGYTGNAKFVSELIKEVQKIEKERTEMQKPEEHKGDKENEHLTLAQKAIKEYKELLKEITEKYQRPEGDEFVKQEAYSVLKEDIEYIIGHIQ